MYNNIKSPVGWKSLLLVFAIVKLNVWSISIAAGLDTIDTNKLDELEQNLIDAQQALDDARIDERYCTMMIL